MRSNADGCNNSCSCGSGFHAEGGICQLTMHPHIIGYRSRIFIVEEIIRHAQAKGDVWFATHREVVDWARTHAA